MLNFNRELVERLRRDPDAQALLAELLKLREARRQELEDCNAELPSRKLQGYCQALTDMIKLLSAEGR